MERFKPIGAFFLRIWKRFSPKLFRFYHYIFEIIRRFWKKNHLMQILLLAGLILILLTILFFAFTASRANVQSLKDGLKQSTVIYDKNGEVATSVDTNRTEGVDVTQLPDYIPNAVVAIEDRRFYEHNGFDLKGITRAFFNNLFSGRITGGGSTITQQLAKNALLSSEQTYRRKIEELFLAAEIEKSYKKDEILSMYVNQVYFGSGAWGIERAAHKYFNKDIKNISISESATLAGLLQSPSALDPYKHYDRAMKRRDLVLSSMYELGMITEDEFQKAKSEKIILEDGGGSYIKRDYPYYVDAVLDEAITKYGLTQEEIITRGYHIYTEMDQNIQAALEKVYNQNSVFPTGRGGVLVQSGAVFLDPKTGGILGLVGGRGEYVFRGFNRATHMKAQPGSTIKPLSVYTPALEEGFKTTSLLKDEPLVFGDYAPENFSRTYEGEVPMYKAIEQSLNIPTVWLLNEIGMEKGVSSLKKFGINIIDEDKNLGSIALGGMSKGVSPQQLAEAYSVFANNGKREDSHLITKIIGPTGTVIAEHKNKTTKVTSKKVTQEMTAMLLGVVENGTGKKTQIPDLPLAGKTGSTQLPFSDIQGTKDQWFVGYTPNIVGAIWLGYDQTDRQHYLSANSSTTVVPIYKTIMETIKPFMEKEDFTTLSVQAELNGQENKNRENKLKDQTGIIKDKIKEEAPKWKNTLDQGLQDIREKGVILIEKIENFINH